MSQTYRGGATPLAGSTVVAAAEDISIVDADNYYASIDVEGALQELGTGLAVADVDTQYTAITSANYTINSINLINGHNIYGVNYAGAVSITLPTSVDETQIIIIKDESGLASTNNITLLTA